MTIYLLLFVIACIFLRIYFRSGRSINLVEKIPGPPTFPILGNLLEFNVPIEKQWGVVRRMTARYYPTARFWLGFHRAVVSIRHPDDIEILLTSQKSINKGPSYNYLHPWMKTGLLTSSDDKWRARRKILTPAFHFNILRKYMDIANENSVKFIDTLKAEGNQSVQNLAPLCSEYTLKIILESAMGVALDDVNKKTADEYRQAVYDIGSVIVYRVARPYITEWMMNSLWKLGRMQNKALEILHQFTSKVIDERREYHQRTDNKYLNDVDDMNNNEKFTTDEVYSGRRKRLAMLDLLLSAQQDGLINNEGIEEEVNTFTFEGHDTTAMAMTFTLMLLAEHPEIQQRARSEAKAVLNKSEGSLEMAEMQELQYLERCIKESLRLYPPVSTVTRLVTEDLPLKKYLIPAGTEVIYHLYDTHRDPNFWEEPDKFDPDRFIPDRIKSRHPFSYIPFSAGPRNCIGQKFAMMELKSLIARILYNFKLEPIDRMADMEVLLDIVIRPYKPIRTKFVRIIDD